MSQKPNQRSLQPHRPAAISHRDGNPRLISITPPNRFLFTTRSRLRQRLGPDRAGRLSLITPLARTRWCMQAGDDLHANELVAGKLLTGPPPGDTPFISACRELRSPFTIRSLRLALPQSSPSREIRSFLMATRTCGANTWVDLRAHIRSNVLARPDAWATKYSLLNISGIATTYKKREPIGSWTLGVGAQLSDLKLSAATSRHPSPLTRLFSPIATAAPNPQFAAVYRFRIPPGERSADWDEQSIFFPADRTVLSRRCKPVQQRTRPPAGIGDSSGELTYSKASMIQSSVLGEAVRNAGWCCRPVLRIRGTLLRKGRLLSM